MVSGSNRNKSTFLHIFRNAGQKLFYKQSVML